MGRKQSVSKTISQRKMHSVVKAYKNGGAYIPVPQELAGKEVEIKVLKKSSQ